MELEKGMYVRTKDNGILKIRHRNYMQGDKFWSCERYKNELYSSYIDEREMIKASHNIIDLIEQRDIIDGIELLDMDVWRDFKNYGNIKTILTKEQYEKYAYKVVE